ncbi:MAG: D-glycerate dehydrogenase [Acidimicrobiia bacterium]
MARILITRELPPGALDVLDGHEILGPPASGSMTHDEIKAVAPSVEAIICLLNDRIDADIIEAASPASGGRLKIIANAAVGYDNIDIEAAHRLGITATNTPGVLDETTADTTFLLMLAAARVASTAEADLRAGQWSGWGINQYLGHDVHRATLGIVGYGRIGRAVARRATGFNMVVLHNSRTPTGEPGYVADLDELVTGSDIISLHVPATPETHHLIDARRIALMKATATIVNTSRGTVIDEAALAEALHNNLLFAAGLDVYEREPAVHPRLLSAPRTVLLPHIGSASAATRRAIADTAIANVLAVLNGKPAPNAL